MNQPRKVPIRGNLLCLHIMAWCKEQPITSHQMQERSGIDCDTCLLWATNMTRLGLLHIVEWRKAEKRGKRAAVFAYGSGESLSPPVSRKMRRPIQMAGVAALAAMWRELEQPTSVAEIGDATGMSKATIGRLLRAARLLGMTRVGDWERRTGCGGEPTPLHVLGAGPDALRPKPLPNTVIHKAYRDRLKTHRGMSRVVAGHVANATAFRESA